MTDDTFLRILRGNPTAEDVAAIVGALLPRLRPVPVAAPGPALSRWRASTLPAGAPHPGPGAWKASALPVR